MNWRQRSQPKRDSSSAQRFSLSSEPPPTCQRQSGTMVAANGLGPLREGARCDQRDAAQVLRVLRAFRPAPAYGGSSAAVSCWADHGIPRLASLNVLDGTIRRAQLIVCIRNRGISDVAPTRERAPASPAPHARLIRTPCSCRPTRSVVHATACEAVTEPLGNSKLVLRKSERSAGKCANTTSRECEFRPTSLV